jgi:hypothetical protein
MFANMSALGEVHVPVRSITSRPPVYRVMHSRDEYARTWRNMLMASIEAFMKFDT